MDSATGNLEKAYQSTTTSLNVPHPGITVDANNVYMALQGTYFQVMGFDVTNGNVVFNKGISTGAGKATSMALFAGNQLVTVGVYYLTNINWMLTAYLSTDTGAM